MGCSSRLKGTTGLRICYEATCTASSVTTFGCNGSGGMGKTCLLLCFGPTQQTTPAFGPGVMSRAVLVQLHDTIEYHLISIDHMRHGKGTCIRRSDERTEAP